MLELMIAALVVVVLIGVAVLVLRSRSAAQRPSSGRADPLADEVGLYRPHEIGVGDIVTHAGIDHVVRGTIVLEEGGYRWREHLLDGSSGRRWLSVEDDEGALEMALWTRREDASGLDPTGDVVLDDRVYRQVERGRAAFTAEGTTGTAATGSVDYADYATADGTGLLAFERWAATQSWEVSTGRSISRGELRVLHSAPPE